MAWGPDRWRLYRLVGREAARTMRAALARLSAPPELLARVRVGALVIAPQDLRTSDATFADDIYAGLFVFAGRSLAAGGGSPFDYAPPSSEWADELYGFGWLRHLRAADTALARANARSFVTDFISGRGDPVLARQTSVAARRLISFLCQSPLVLEGADHGFYDSFLRAIGRNAQQLERDLRRGVPPPARLTAAVALCYAGLCCDGIQPILRRATRVLSRELERQVLTDGGHRSRNPRFGMELLLDLLPLRQAFLSRSVEPPAALLRAVDRMLPLLRLLRHPDASLSHFNGMGATDADHLATLLVYDDTFGRPMMHAPNSGYERLEGGRVVVTADVGACAPLAYSLNATAGCLSFEMSSGPQRIVVNCGVPASGADLRLLARSTAAHSTATVANTSSCRFLVKTGWWWERRMSAWLARHLGPVVLRGPEDVVAERDDQEGGVRLAGRHDGYLREFGLIHERRWHLFGEEGRLEGQDAFVRPSGAKPRLVGRGRGQPVAVRFHIHPAIAVREVPGGIELASALGEIWLFDAEGAEVRIEESVYFSGLSGPRRTDQIALHLTVTDGAEVRWTFARLAGAAPR